MIRVNEWLAWAETTPRFWPGTTARKCYGMEAAIVRRAVRRAPEARRGTESNGLQHSSSIRPRQPRRNPQCSRGQPRPPKWRTCNNKSSDQSYDVAAPEPKVWRKRRKIIEFCRRKEGALFVTFKLCWQSCRLCQTRVGRGRMKCVSVSRDSKSTIFSPGIFRNIKDGTYLCTKCDAVK